MYKNFSIFKNSYKKEGSTEPDYKLSLNIGTKEEPQYVDCGAGWIKENSKGKFISVQLSKSFADHTKNIARKGFALVQEGETELVKSYEKAEAEEVLDHKFVVGTRESNGHSAIFRVASDTLEEAMQEVKEAMIESGVANPVVLALIEGTKPEEIAVPCEPVEPELA